MPDALAAKYRSRRGADRTAGYGARREELQRLTGAAPLAVDARLWGVGFGGAFMRWCDFPL